jgi:hypothetical protein
VVLTFAAQGVCQQHGRCRFETKEQVTRLALTMKLRFYAARKTAESDRALDVRFCA